MHEQLLDSLVRFFSVPIQNISVSGLIFCLSMLSGGAEKMATRTLVAVALAFLVPARAWTPAPSTALSRRNGLTSVAAGFGKASAKPSGSPKKGQEVEKLKSTAAAKVSSKKKMSS
jgi:hypothetical protein